MDSEDIGVGWMGQFSMCSISVHSLQRYSGWDDLGLFSSVHVLP